MGDTSRRFSAEALQGSVSMDRYRYSSCPGGVSVENGKIGMVKYV